MRLIDADKLKTSLNETVDAAIKWHEDCLGEIMQNRSEAAITAFIECILRLKEQPTVDAVEVVRCKDCVHKPYVVDVFHASYGDIPVLESNGKCPCINADDYFYSHMPDDDWFCANGERREADEH